MRKQYLSGAAVIVLLSVLILAGANAATSGSTGTSVSPDAKGKVNLWNSGSNCFLNEGVSGTAKFSHSQYFTGILSGFLEFPVGATNAELICPMTVPASINGEECKVKTIYLVWIGSSVHEINHITISSGYSTVWDSAVSYVGAAPALQTITIDLGDSYAIPNGLTIAFDIHNTASTLSGSHIFSYGARIKYKQ